MRGGPVTADELPPSHVQLTFNWSAIGVDKASARLEAPSIAPYQCSSNTTGRLQRQQCEDAAHITVNTPVPLLTGDQNRSIGDHGIILLLNSEGDKITVGKRLKTDDFKVPVPMQPAGVELALKDRNYPKSDTDYLALKPGHTCDAKAFGAKGDGATLDTRAIQSAIASCSHHHIDGGPRSKVLLNGTFLSGPIRLLSHVELVIGAGSKLLSTADIEHWPWCKPCGQQWPCAGSGDFPCIDTTAVPFITGLDAVHIAITGEGASADTLLARPDSSGNPRPGTPVIDGRGGTWMAANFNRKTSNKTLHDLMHDHRPHVIQLVNCSDVVLANVFIHDSPMYHISLYRGSGFEISNLVLWSPAAATSSIGYWNTDGIDIGAEFVHVRNVYVHNGDDSIIVKGRYPEASPPSAECFGGRHVLVENCTAVGVAQDLKVILTPPCIFNW
jgi:hypothetical protein